MDNDSKNTGVLAMLGVIVIVLVIAVVGFVVWTALRSNSDNSSDEDQTDTDSDSDTSGDTEDQDTSDEDVVVDDEDTDTDQTDEDETPSGDFTNYSENTQTLGDSADKATAEYTLASITDSEQVGFHRFIFDLESTQTGFADVEAQLVSSGGYIRLRLDRVTDDNSGIIYQGTRDINQEGVLRLYHAVTPNESEEVYQIGISQDTTFYLHSMDGLKVVLDVKYPGTVADTGDAEDSMAFTTVATTLSGTNTAGDVRFVSYSWSTESTVVKFIWGTSSATGNPTPPTSVTYNAAAKTVTVTFTGVQSDSVIGSDGTFSAPLSTIVDEVTGSRTGTTSTYVFHLNGESRYRIYRSSSPNQVVLDIER
jgi:hypothetical protein